MEWLTSPEAWIALVTLTFLEIVLGVDNVIFISILAGKLPADQQKKARQLGLGLAMFMRIALLASLAWIAKLTTPLFSILGQDVSGRDLDPAAGRAVPAWPRRPSRSTTSSKASTATPRQGSRRPSPSVIIQILLLDIVFSLDSVITAVGMADDLGVMVAAVVIAVGVMMVAAGAISEFVEQHPTVKMLALSFLLLIGLSLVAEGFHQHIPKGYIYFAMGFSVFVEMINLRIRAMRHAPAEAPVELRQRYEN